MKIIEWNHLPPNMQNDSVRPYYDILKMKRTSLKIKRMIDLVGAMILFILLLPLFILVATVIFFESKRCIFFKQIRVTQYGRKFTIYKFRTMISDAQSAGPQLTSSNDNRITKVGKFLRKTKIDEIPQLINVIRGDMTFISTRPEVPNYVAEYSDEMLASLLLPAGISSEASVMFKNESQFLNNPENIENIYINKILPNKMKINLLAVKNFSILNDLRIMLLTIGGLFMLKEKCSVEDGQILIGTKVNSKG